MNPKCEDTRIWWYKKDTAFNATLCLVDHTQKSTPIPSPTNIPPPEWQTSDSCCPLRSCVQTCHPCGLRGYNLYIIACQDLVWAKDFAWHTHNFRSTSSDKVHLVHVYSQNVKVLRKRGASPCCISTLRRTKQQEHAWEFLQRA